jgi:hypothetical protein
MPANPFDQASRYFAKLDSEDFLGWLLGLTLSQFAFRGWLDTRRLPFPGELDRINDTVAHIEDLQNNHEPWALILEFQIEPDALLFGRALIYGGQLWIELKPVQERGDRFNIGILIVNLTGRGRTGRTMQLKGTRIFTAMQPQEINLCELDAQSTLNDIVAGTTPRVVLPLIPLMQGGGDLAIIQQWMVIASKESDARRRGEYAGLAQVFAEATDHADVWIQALKGWNMIQSKVVNGWKAEERVEALLEVLDLRFGSIPSDLETTIRAMSDLATLKKWVAAAVTAGTLADFRQTCQL